MYPDLRVGDYIQVDDVRLVVTKILGDDFEYYYDDNRRGQRFTLDTTIVMDLVGHNGITHHRPQALPEDLFTL